MSLARRSIDSSRRSDGGVCWSKTVGRIDRYSWRGSARSAGLAGATCNPTATTPRSPSSAKAPRPGPCNCRNRWRYSLARFLGDAGDRSFLLQPQHLLDMVLQARSPPSRLAAPADGNSILVPLREGIPDSNAQNFLTVVQILAIQHRRTASRRRHHHQRVPER